MANSTDQALFRYVQHTYASDGISLHPLQRAGELAAEGTSSWWGRTFRASSRHIYDSPPARFDVAPFPQYVPVAGSPRDERFMVS